ncbi:clusterin-like protein 1 isoform X1 [Trematomus bernacchii]|uniref:clusterin-like protein 1 isoform X1 n=1 Tax=Trematomus bernacchii TaxID=40690 RepID=UPI00146C9F90|nr:clusterin-like protein 1 isoform X1 [Trematomus bernacchii]XP_034008842.1 clusterin-like protein 1 isoform X1 [Trematomus bernacchii]
MKLLLGLFVLGATLGVLYSAPEDEPTGISKDTLQQLSLDGEKLVDEEVRRALYGVKQMREVMWRNEQKHEHLMKSLRHSSDKKKEADQLTKEVKQKLQEAEQQCKESLQSEWEQCRPCLEDACKTFYTSTCRRGYGFFHAKVENFFRRVSGHFGPKEARLDAGDILVNQGPEDSDMEADRIEESFSSLSSRVGGLVNRSVELVSRMSGRLDQVLQKAFLNYTDSLMEEDTADPYDPARDSSFLQGVGLEDVLESFFDFGKSVVEEFGAVVTQRFEDIQKAVEEQKKKGREMFPRFLQNRKLCRDLRKQTSECWQLQSQCEACQGALLTECPSVRDLHVELDEASQMLDVSTEQYDEILSIVHHHTDETVNWLSNMAADFSWVAQSVNSNTPENIFSVNVVAPNTQDEQNESETETKVEVNILNSPPIIFSVPGELKLRDPAFIQYVTQKALSKYKEMVRYDEDE